MKKRSPWLSTVTAFSLCVFDLRASKAKSACDVSWHLVPDRFADVGKTIDFIYACY